MVEKKFIDGRCSINNSTVHLPLLEAQYLLFRKWGKISTPFMGIIPMRIRNGVKLVTKKNSSFERNYHHPVPKRSTLTTQNFLMLKKIGNYEFILNTPQEIISPHFEGEGTLRSWYIITFVRQHLEHQIHFSARVFFNGPAKN